MLLLLVALIRLLRCHGLVVDFARRFVAQEAIDGVVFRAFLPNDVNNFFRHLMEVLSIALIDGCLHGATKTMMTYLGVFEISAGQCGVKCGCGGGVVWYRVSWMQE